MSDMTERQLQQEAEDEAPWGAEAKRQRAIRNQRRDKGLCPLCGKPFNFFEKLAKRTEHRDCSRFVE